MTADPKKPMDVDARPLVTRSSLVKDLRCAGIQSGDILLVHSALSRLGFVVGAARAVIEALLDVVGPDGTIMMPAYSGELSDPASWQYPPVPTEWIDIIRKEMPPYDPNLTPTRGMGVIAELFRHYPGARRSAHPQSSFTAIGPAAGRLVDQHPLDFRFGPASPLGMLCRLGGKVLMLGAPATTCSLYYLSEYEMPAPRQTSRIAPLIVDGKARWVQYMDLEYSVNWFEDVTQFLVAEGIFRTFHIGNADCLLCSAKSAVAAVTQFRRSTVRDV